MLRRPPNAGSRERGNKRNDANDWCESADSCNWILVSACPEQKSDAADDNEKQGSACMLKAADDLATRVALDDRSASQADIEEKAADDLAPWGSRADRSASHAAQIEMAADDLATWGSRADRSDGPANKSADPNADDHSSRKCKIQGRTEPTSGKMVPEPFPGGSGPLRREPLAQGPSPSILDFLVRNGSFFRHTLQRDGSAAPGELREGHWDSSHSGCAVPSSKSPISHPYLTWRERVAISHRTST